MSILMETDTDRTGVFYKIIIWIKTIIPTLVVHFVCYDIQLTKMVKQVNKEKKLPFEGKSINLGYCNGGTRYV